MSVPQSVASILRDHVKLEVESLDRLYLNLYIPTLQRVPGVLHFFRDHRGQPIASSALMAPISAAFVAAIKAFAASESVPLVDFKRGQRKDDIAKAHLARFSGDEGILFVGRAQEKVSVFRTEKRHNRTTGRPYAWIVRSTAIVNQYYIYAVDADFGPFFMKFSSYFPYTGRLCLNGHEYAKRQLARAGVAYEPLDNGFRSCADPAALQAVCDGLSAARIEALAHKWLARLPSPFSPADRAAGYRYELSVLQAEVSLTQVFDRPLTGRIFFEEVIRENLDLGRPDQVSLIFNRRVTRQTPGPFRTRVITEGVTPHLYVDYKSSRIKQYHKEGRALRTETVINDARDFGIGKRLVNLPALREVGAQANRRLLDVQRISHDPILGDETFDRLTQPALVDGQRASALRFADQRTQTLLSVLVIFRLQAAGFAARDLRRHLAPLLGRAPDELRQGRVSYELRRLRLHGLIERIPRSHRYRVTALGFRTACFFTRAYGRLIRPGLAQLVDPRTTADTRLRLPFQQLELAIDRWAVGAKLAA
ncbi:MAG: hypothetical protein ACRDGD_01150 [Candidatus Limnocylindria bacterium]